MKKSDAKSIKRDNTALILRRLSYGQVSRAQLVDITGLSKATVTAIVSELIAQGAVEETGSEGSGVGRPRTSLSLVAGYKYAVGMALHRKRLSVSLVDLSFRTVDSLSYATTDFSDAKEALDTLYEGIETLCERNGIPKEKLLGIGVSAPGPLDSKKGVIHNPPGLYRFHGVSIKKHLSQKTDLPIFLDNNATLLAMRENRIRWGTLKNWTFVVVKDGIGSATFSDGKLIRGKSGYAGELGHISVDEDGDECPCGNHGCLERVLSPKKIEEKFGFSSYADAVDAAFRFDENGMKAIRYVATHLSRALAGVVNLLNPEAIVFYGDYNENYPVLFAKLEDALLKKSAVARHSKLQLLPAFIESDGIVASSADAVLEAYFSQEI